VETILLLLQRWQLLTQRRAAVVVKLTTPCRCFSQRTRKLQQRWSLEWLLRVQAPLAAVSLKKPRYQALSLTFEHAYFEYLNILEHFILINLLLNHEEAKQTCERNQWVSDW